MRDLAEDATGFGAGELRMTRELVLKPQSALVGMASGDPAYPRPFRYYLAVNAIFLILAAMLGGYARSYEQMLPPEAARYLADLAGKSLEALYADLDQWYSLSAPPVLALAYYPPLTWLFGRWTRDRLPPSGQAFAYLSGWTLLGMPFGLTGILFPDVRNGLLIFSAAILSWLFFRMGRGLWWTTPAGFVGRFLQVVLALLLSTVIAGLATGIIAGVGAVLAP